MGCSSCGKRRNAGTIAAQRRAAQLSAMNTTPGSSADKPIIIGAADNSDPVYVMLLADAYGLSSGATVWVSGDGVEAAIEEETIAYSVYGGAIAWKVNGHLFTDQGEAERFAARTGGRIVEVI